MPRKSDLAGPLTSGGDTLLPFNVQINDHRVRRERFVQLIKEATADRELVHPYRMTLDEANSEVLAFSSD